MFKKVESFFKKAQGQFVDAINDATEFDNEDEPGFEQSLGALWEESEHVNYCRNCLESFSMPLIKRKHHCRKCGGIYYFNFKYVPY
jgi:hypothetical protein